MAVYTGGAAVSQKTYTGLSTDTKPTGTTVTAFDLFWETDTGKMYAFNGAGWVLQGQNIAYDYRGQYPETWYLSGTGSIGTNDNDIVYTSPDISMYNKTLIECTAGTVDIEVTLDGTTYNTTAPALLLLDATAVTTYSLTVVSGKIGAFPHKVKGLRVRQNGATPSNCRYAHSVQ